MVSFKGIEFKLGDSRHTYKCGVCKKILTPYEYDNRRVCLSCGTSVDIVDPIIINN